MNHRFVSRRVSFVFTAFVISLLAVVLNACAVGNAVSQIPAAAQAVLSQAREYYKTGRDQETAAINLRRAYEVKDSSFRLGVQDLYSNNKSCFKDAATLETAVASAVMSNKSGGELVNALSTASVSGEAATVACIQLKSQLADYIIASRTGVQNAYLMSYEAATKYQLHLDGYPELKFMNDLMQTYLSTDGVIHALAIDGVGVTDITWLPTMSLYVDLPASSPDCQDFSSGAFVSRLPQITKDKFTGHMDALSGLYSVQMNARGGCRVFRAAALYEMTLPLLSAQTQQVIGSGVDQGAIPTDTTEPSNQ